MSWSFWSAAMGRFESMFDGSLPEIADLSALSDAALVDAAGAVESSITDERGLVAAFLADVPGIRRIVLDAARQLGIAVGWLIGVLNVQHVLLVGPVAEFGADWLDEVRRHARASVLPLLARDTQIEFGHVQDDVVVLGASALLMEQQLGLALVR